MPPPAAPGVVPAQPKRIGRYDILAAAGAGGMGIVYRARDTALDRIVALKVMIAGEHASRETLARFDREARAAAKLDHPGIVRVYDVGAEGSAHYIAMEFVEGRALDRQLRDPGVAPQDAARMVRDVARALAVAHAQGIVHRDIKPANVLVDGAGAARLTDFGLAKTGDEDGGLTRTDQVMGTACYMPPEQVSGMRSVDGQSDVYSLGAVLYEVLTKKRPFEGETMAAVLRAVEDREPSPPSRVVAHVPRDLETICLTAMAKQKSKRYASATAMAEDLDRFLEGAPVAARREGVLSRSWRWARRRPALSATGALALVLAATLAWQLRTRGVRQDRLELLNAARPDFSAGVADYEAARKIRRKEDRPLRQGILRSAAANFDKALAIFPDHADALHARARVLRDLNRLPQAMADLDRALELNPALGDARYDRILLRMMFVQDRTIEGTFVVLPQDLAMICAEERRLLDADIAELRNLGVLRPRMLTAEALVRLAFEPGFDPLPALAEALAMDPTFADAFLARALYRLGNRVERPDAATRRNLAGAESDASIAVEQEPNFREAWMARAQIRLRLGREKEALEDLDEAVSIAPDEPRTILERLMVVFLSSVGTGRHRSRMLKDVERVLVIEPGNTRARLVRAALDYQDLVLGGTPRPVKESRDDLERILRDEPEMGAGWYLAMAFDLAAGDDAAFAAHRRAARKQFEALPVERTNNLVEMAQGVDMTRKFAAMTPGIRDSLAAAFAASDEARWADAEKGYREVLRRIDDASDPEGGKLLMPSRILFQQMTTLRLAGALAGQRKTDEAFRTLENGLEAGVSRDGSWTGDSELAPLRLDPRWAALVEKFAPK